MLVRHHQVSRSKRGSALVASLLSVMVVASMGAGLMQLHGSMSAKQELSIDTKRALYMAEAGLSEAFIAIAQGKSGKVGSPELPARFGDGVYWVDATELTDARVQLDAVGLAGSGRFALSLILQRESNPIASLGAFGGNRMDLSMGAVVDGYDSQEGSFESQLDQQILGLQTTGRGGRVSSNGDIELEGGLGVGRKLGLGSKIFGDAAPGPLAAVNLGSGAEVTGVTLPMPEEVYTPTIEIPDMLDAPAVVHNNPAEPLCISKVDKHFESITISTLSKVTLCGPSTVVADQLILQPGAELEFDATNGPIVIFVADSLDLALGSRLSNVDHDPAKVAMLVNGANVNLGATGEFFGLFYAPNASVTIPSTLHVYGSAAADELTLGQNARLTIDHGMLASSVAGMENLPRIRSWKISQLPQEKIVTQRTDPLTQLDIAGITPTPTAVAHQEKFVRLVYRGLDKHVYAYSGPESELDWGNVLKPIRVKWARRESEFNGWDGWEDYGGADMDTVGLGNGGGFGMMGGG